MESVLTKEFNYTTLYSEAIIDATGEMNFDEYRRMFYNYIINKHTRRMLTIVVYGRGQETKLNVDCNISFDEIDQTKLTLDHACTFETLL